MNKYNETKNPQIKENKIKNLTPDDLFKEFRKGRLDLGIKALNKFNELDYKVKSTFLKPTIEFLNMEKVDIKRSWGTSVLQSIGGKEAFQYIVDLLQKANNQEKEEYRHTRFFALKAIKHIAESSSQKKELLEIIEKISKDKNEHDIVHASSLILLSKRGVSKHEAMLKKKLKDYEEIDDIWAILRALREYPLTILTDEILSIIRDCQYIDLKHTAIRTLGTPAYKDNTKVIRTLGEVIVTNQLPYLRLEAVHSLKRLRNRAAQSDLIYALKDIDAEIRVQAVNALKSFLSAEEAVSAIVQYALSEEIDEEYQDYLIDAIRLIDRDGAISTKILGNELDGEDKTRSAIAERILINLGGSAAVQRLSQRRSTLKSLDKLLEISEESVKQKFQDTIKQAHRNFYFAMGINILVVIVGLILVTIAIIQLINYPEKIEAWIIPGGGGVLGIIINMYFNNPRHNAREDLSILLNVNIIFLGFLRQLNEIDATFKYAYLENPNFGVKQMKETVYEIEKSLNLILEMTDNHLQISKNVKNNV